MKSEQDAEMADAISPTDRNSSAPTTTTLAIQGMTCTSCSSTIESALSAIPGVSSVSVSLMTNSAVITHSATLDPMVLQDAVNDTGFDASITNVKVVDLKIFGMTCTSCSTTVESVLRQVPGVQNALVTLTLESAAVEYNSKITNPRLLIQAVEDAGFDAMLAQSADNTAQVEALARVKEIQTFKRKALYSFCLCLPVMVLVKLVPHPLAFLQFVKTPVFGSWPLYYDDIINFCLTTPIQFRIARPFYVHAWKALKRRSPNMDVLVVMSTSCAYFFSVLSVLAALITGSALKMHPMTLWETSGMIVTFVMFGKYLESKAKGQTSVALSRLISLVPSTATIYEDPLETESESAKLTSIATELLQPGDVVVLKPGEKVPADGIVRFGTSHVSEALVTGESYPVVKTVGDTIIGGSVNGQGRLEFLVTHSGENTKLSQIIKLVQGAQASRAPVQRFADIASAYFVPCVLALSIVTFVVWMIVAHAMGNGRPKMLNGTDGPFFVCLRLCISVIVVACPCALGLATPTAVMVATGVGAQHGILIKGGDVIESASHVGLVLFDKTGTLTQGKMSVTKWENISQISTSLWWKIVGTTETSSEHPISRALVSYAKETCGLDSDAMFPSMEVTSFEAIPGEGVRAQVSSTSESRTYNVLIGSAQLLKHSGVVFSDIDHVVESNDTPCFVCIDDTFVGWVLMSDPVKEDAAKTVAALKEQGKMVAMVTGDSYSVAQKIASIVGIDENMVFAQVTPAGKIQLVEQLQRTATTNDEELTFSHIPSTINLARNSVLAMVGDGINDSPALAAAAVGISMAGATDVAVETADIVLLKEQSLLDIPASLDLCRQAMKRIKINLLAAVLYNLIMIPFAMGIFMPFGLMLNPMMASAAMALSSVSVLVSSLMLQRWVPPHEGPSQGILSSLFSSRSSNVDYTPIQTN